jgi:hypothetical protein
MKVSELIAMLNEVNQDKLVYAWDDGRLLSIGGVDELDDRIDLNVGGES